MWQVLVYITDEIAAINFNNCQLTSSVFSKDFAAFNLTLALFMSTVIERQARESKSIIRDLHLVSVA